MTCQISFFRMTILQNYHKWYKARTIKKLIHFEIITAGNFLKKTATNLKHSQLFENFLAPNILYQSKSQNNLFVRPFVIYSISRTYSIVQKKNLIQIRKQLEYFYLFYILNLFCIGASIKFERITNERANKIKVPNEHSTAVTKIVSKLEEGAQFV